MSNSTDDGGSTQSTTNIYTIALLSFTGAMILLILIIWLTLKLMGIKSPHKRLQSDPDLHSVSTRYGFGGLSSDSSNRPFTQSVGYPISRTDLSALAQINEDKAEVGETIVKGRDTILPKYKANNNLTCMTVIIEVPPNCVTKDELRDLPPEYKNTNSTNTTYLTALSRIF